MRVFRAEYTDRAGGKQNAAKWYIDFFDHNRLRHRIPAFADKRTSEAFGRNIQSLVDCRVSGLDLDIKLNQWLETIPDKLLKQLTSWGLIEGQRAEITKPLTQHIEDFIASLEAKEFSEGYVSHMKNYLNTITTDCKFHYFRDITRSAVELYVSGLRKKGFKDTTIGHYIDSLKTFLNWAEQDRRILNNPVAKMEKPARDSAKKGILTPEQFILLIKTTIEKNILIENITGQERTILYLLAGTTGIRRNELLNLIWDDINLSGGNAFVRVRASIAKNGIEALQPIPPITANVLNALRSDIKAEDTGRVFAGLTLRINTADLIRQDLTAAGIPLIDKDGNEICFHSLRNSFISYLANSETPAKVIQELARHSDPRLTFNTYARTFEDSKQKAMNFLPNFGNFVFATCLANDCQKQGISIDSQRQQKLITDAKTVLLTNGEMRVRGVEPLRA